MPELPNRAVVVEFQKGSCFKVSFTTDIYLGTGGQLQFQANYTEL